LLNNASWSGGAGGKEIRGLGFRGDIRVSGFGRRRQGRRRRKKRGLKLACGSEEEKGP